MLKKILTKYFYPPPVAWKLKRHYSHCYVCGTAFNRRTWTSQIEKACKEIEQYIKEVQNGKKEAKD